MCCSAPPVPVPSANRMQLWERQIAPGRAVRDHLKISQEIPVVISVDQT